MKTTTLGLKDVLRSFQVAIAALLILSPFVPWYPNDMDGGTVSLWVMWGADAIDAIGNLTYDGFTLRQTLAMGYLTSALVLGSYLLCSWGSAISILSTALTGHSSRQRWHEVALALSMICLAWVGFSSYGTLRWGYWTACTALLILMGLTRSSHRMNSASAISNLLQAG